MRLKRRRDSVSAIDTTNQRLLSDSLAGDLLNSLPQGPRVDARQWAPTPDVLPAIRRLRAIDDVPRLRTLTQPRRGYDIYNPMHWIREPRPTWICLKRKLRREVLAALHFVPSGRGAGGPRWDAAMQRRRQGRTTTKIKCRR